MESDEDDGQGVILDPNGYALIDGRQRGFAGDELYFTGYDLGQARRGSQHSGYYEEPQQYNDEEDYYQRGMQGRNGREDAIAHSAYDRIARARAQGMTSVSLTLDEMEMLERRRGVQQPAPPPPPMQVVSPPVTPQKAIKGKANGRTGSSSSISSLKGRKKTSNGLFSPSTPPSAKSNSKAKVSRKSSVEQAAPYSPNNQPPGVLIPGPNGVPVYAPLAYYPPSPEFTRAQPSSAHSRSRSTSKHSRRESTPPEPVYAAYPPRYYPPPAGMRPPSSSSNRSAQDDMDWYAPSSSGRVRSASNAQYRIPDDYAPNLPPMPAVQGRRNTSGPPDISYSSLRRVPPSSSPLAPRPVGVQHYSDPAMVGRKGSGLSQEVESGSSGSNSDDQGVQVNILPDEGGRGYAVQRTAVKGNEARRRKASRR